MQLTNEQKATVSRWVEEGSGLNEVQRRIQEEFGVSMTYMDVRFLVLDIGAEVKDKEPAKVEEPELKQAEQSEGDDSSAESPSALGGELVEEETEIPSATKVTISLDKVVRAGALASGEVVFSDGVTGGWLLDRMGRLSLTKVSQPDYQPSEADLEAFQVELQKVLSAMY